MRVADDESAALRFALTSHGRAPSNEAVRNEDAAYAGAHLLVVADGFESLSSPGSASKIAVEELRRLDVLTCASDLAASLELAITDLRRRLRELLTRDPRWSATGTALTAMLWRDTHAVIGHIGDTRAYMLRGGELTQLTRDHTYGQLLIDADMISPGELGFDPTHHALHRVLDGRSDEPVDIIVHEAKLGDRYLLSTDGLHDVVSPDALRNMLQDTGKGPQSVVDDIVYAALLAKHYDDCTCIVADVVSSGAPIHPGAVSAGAALR